VRRVRGWIALLPRELLLLPAALCAVAAILVALVAVDVVRWRDAIERDDVRYAAGAPSSGWKPATLAPLGLGERVLAVSDDVDFRRMLLLLRSSKLRDVTVSDPVLAIRRTDLTEQLEAILARNPDPRVRSRAASLLGVLNIAAWNSAPSIGADRDRSELLLAAVAAFEQAIDLDWENDDAKYNLQVMLQRGQGLLPTEAAAGRNPAPGGQGSRGAGAGAPGSGY
jgi:hypothetical protein